MDTAYPHHFEHLKHLEHLKKLIALEQEEETRRYADINSDQSLGERERQGFSLANLEIKGTSLSPSGHTLVDLGRVDGQVLPNYAFDVGEGASLCLHGKDFYFKQSAVVFERDEKYVTLALNKPIKESMENAGDFFLLKSPNRVIYRYMEKTLEQMCQATDGHVASLRDISLGIKKPKPARTLDPHPTYTNQALNDVQKRAVQIACANPQITLIHGPPGTGKTTVLVEIIVQAVQKGQQVFVCAPSNTACDNLLKKITDAGVNALRLGHPARIHKDLRRYTSGYQAAAHPLSGTLDFLSQELDQLSKRRHRLEDRYGAYDSRTKEIRYEIKRRRKDIGALKQQIAETILEEAQICIGTLAGVLSYEIGTKKFDCVVIDEATQATEPMSWIPVVKAKTLVMAGDHRQLPPTVLSQEAKDLGLGVSLFERLYDRARDEHKIMLTIQYRMNEHIMALPSRQFYEGRLIADSSVKQRLLADLPGVPTDEWTTKSVEFVDTAGKGFQEMIEPGSESRYNPEEGQIVVFYVEELFKRGVMKEGIAVISPYRAQSRRLRRRLEVYGIEINTVDGFQGREKEVIIVTCVRSNLEGELGFLADLRRINVAITRAKKKLIIIGDGSTLASLPFFEAFIKYAESLGGYKSAWELPI